MSASPLRILVVEDDPKIASLLVDYLRHDGFDASSLADGVQALQAIEQDTPDAIVLDLMLPGMDGLAVCQAVRQFSDVPILMLTARVEEVDRLMGLDSGADDYVCKPFSPREVMARVRALVRRSKGRVVQTPASAWSFDEAAKRIAWRGQWLTLTPVEYRILHLLMGHPGRIYSRAQLLDQIHNDLRDVSDRAVDSHIKNVRRKLQAAVPGLDCIASVYGLGYRFDAPEPVA
jgi:two-component system response regulator BaeR